MFQYDSPVENVLVDKRNIDQWDKFMVEQMSINQNFVGFDIETHNKNAHEGIKKLMKVDTDGYSHGKKLIFDFKRTTITGVSFYFGHQRSDVALYVNFGHSDVENRISMDYLWKWLDLAKANNVNPIIHNRQYEHSVFLGSYGYELPDAFCSMQLCVSAYNPDEYRKSNLSLAVSNGIKPLVAEIEQNFSEYERGELTFKQQETLAKFCAKTGAASHSYEGIVKSIAYGYGLKKAVKSWFGHQMIDFKETLSGAADMGDIPADQVVHYGADDAVWAYRLFFRMYQYMSESNPKALKTYLETENPVIKVFSRACINGLKVNTKQVTIKQTEMRGEVARNLVEFKQELRKIFPSSLPEIHTKLAKYEKWYKPESHLKYYNQVKNWLEMSDDLSDFQICTQVKNSTGNAWFQEETNSTKHPPNAQLSINHYMAMRFILFVVCDLPCKATGGKIQSDGDARTEMLAEIDEEHKGRRIIELYKKLGSAEQAFKLYITPYLYLIDPDTNLMHPIVSSLLATRRMSCSSPNGQQLSKRGDSVFVRGFFQADDPDSVIISADWSAIELVGVASNSQDPAMLEVYSQRPHKDLHSKAAAGVMKLSAEEFAALPDKKVHRTILGKGSNFEYWYSGWLANTAKRMGWSMDETAEAVKGYVSEFPTAEAWRLSVIETIKTKGVVQIADGHTRVRYEATEEWASIIWEVFSSFGSDAMLNFANEAIRRIQRRAANQAVNFTIQGLCAALTKRTILDTDRGIRDHAFNARFMLPIHDELLFSVKREQAAAFCDYLYQEMIKDSELLPNVMIDSSVAVGYTFQPFDAEKSPYGQIELMEIQKGVPCINESSWESKATESERDAIIKYLTIDRMIAAA